MRRRPAVLTRTCVGCARILPLAVFIVKGRAGDRCRQCPGAAANAGETSPDRDVLHDPGSWRWPLTTVQSDRLREILGDACGICGRTDQPLVTDHDHFTAKIRGRLCGLCNRGVGAFRDRPGVLRAAATYLDYPPFLARLHSIRKDPIS